MTNKDKKAISSLKKHKEKLEDKSNINRGWISKLTDILLNYLGSDSQLYANSKLLYNRVNIREYSYITNCKELIDNAVEYIEENGVKKDRTFWKTIEDMNQNVLYAIITLIFSSIFYVGYWTGENNISKDIKPINDKLDNILRVISPNISDIPTDSDTTSNKKDDMSHKGNIVNKTDSIVHK